MVIFSFYAEMAKNEEKLRDLHNRYPLNLEGDIVLEGERIGELQVLARKFEPIKSWFIRNGSSNGGHDMKYFKITCFKVYIENVSLKKDGLTNEWIINKLERNGEIVLRKGKKKLFNLSRLKFSELDSSQQNGDLSGVTFTGKIREEVDKSTKHI